MRGSSFLDIEQAITTLKRLTASWPAVDQQRLTQAIVLARTKHAGQSYLPAREYAIHPIRAALSLAERTAVEPDVIIATVLHDTLEDTDLTEDELRDQFGERVATLVKLVSHRFTASSTMEEKIAAKQENLTEIRRGPVEVRLIKCADLLDQMRNWRLLPHDSIHRPKLLRFLEEAQAYALPLAEESDEGFAEAMRHELQWFYVHAV